MPVKWFVKPPALFKNVSEFYGMDKNVLKSILVSCYKLGIPKFIKALGMYKLEYAMLIKQKGGNKDFIMGKKYPVLMDKYAGSGTAKGAYFHQDLLVAHRIFENNPKEHIDVGSRVDGFVAHVASFRSIKVMDIRPLDSTIKNISFVQQDFMAPLREELIDSCDSLSCLHALEHFGLGRYGDPINYNGHIVGLENLSKLLKPGGKLYFSVPIGLPQRIEFHAHRIFSIKYLLAYFEGKYRIDNFWYVDDEGKLHENVILKGQEIEKNYGCKGNGTEGCGIFEMTKNNL
jgi:SAM-dependent methyltransferase